jgi:hypothetical protein
MGSLDDDEWLDLLRSSFKGAALVSVLLSLPTAPRQAAMEAMAQRFGAERSAKRPRGDVHKCAMLPRPARADEAGHG